MKRTLFWLVFPLTLLITVLFAFLSVISEEVVNNMHKFEGWCFNYENKYKGMTYQGNGVWYSKDNKQ